MMNLKGEYLPYIQYINMKTTFPSTSIIHFLQSYFICSQQNIELRFTLYKNETLSILHSVRITNTNTFSRQLFVISLYKIDKNWRKNILENFRSSLFINIFK